MKDKDPCLDCPARSATCHATCERYLAASEKRRRENEERFYAKTLFYLAPKKGSRK